MIAAGETGLTEVIVVADSSHAVPPCGGCRQKLSEFGTSDVVVTMANLDGTELKMTLAELLPGAFTEAHMDKA
jgi:cytidine deaminase